jgi:hypothetical protein
LGAIAIPAASAFTRLEREVILGGYYVALATEDYPNYYIFMKVAYLTETDVYIDWLYAYRG